MYRKYLEPEYAEAAPEVKIGMPQRIDMKEPGKWRIKTNYETVSSVVSEISRCRCYESLMKVRVENRICLRESKQIPIRFYYPENPPEDGKKPPIMLFCHGGAFSMNNIDVYDPVCRYFAGYGGIIASAVDYRLAPEHPFPCGLEDCYAALEWTAEHASELGGSPDDILVCGDSSGGNFAAVLCILARERKGPVIRKQILIYPVTTMAETSPSESERRYEKGYFLEYQDIQRLPEGYVPEEICLAHPYLSPLYEKELKGLPPAGFFSAECDPLLDQGLWYAARLHDAGVKVEYHIYKGMIHAFLNGTYGKTFEMMDEIGKFARE